AGRPAATLSAGGRPEDAPSDLPSGRAGVRVEDLPEVVRARARAGVWPRIEAEEEGPVFGGGVAAERVRRSLDVRPAEMPDAHTVRALVAGRCSGRVDRVEAGAR